MYRIFIVEDDAVIASAVEGHLRSWGWDARCAGDFGNILAEFAAFDPQLVLMDISLPSYNGYHWCGQIRQVSRVPVIFISSAADNLNIVMAVNMGGDDFIAKPFDLDVLTAKIQAMLRRTYDFAGQSRLLEHRGAVLNVDDGTLNAGNGRIDLTRNEHRILQVLLENMPERQDEVIESQNLKNGPQIDQSKAGVVASQDQVDDLLESLGF